MSEPTVRPTTWAGLLLAGVVGLAVALGARLVWEATAGGVPAPYGTAVVLALLALAVYALSRQARERIQVRREPVEPRQATSWLAIGKGSAVAGAFSIGMFGTWAAVSLGRLAAPLARDRALHSGLAVLAAALLVWAGLRLERACRVPPREDDEDSGTPAEDGAG